jgi:hypothetical protein
MGWIH